LLRSASGRYGICRGQMSGVSSSCPTISIILDCQSNAKGLITNRVRFFTTVGWPKNGFGVNGQVNLLFAGPSLTAVYVDVDGHEPLREEWAANGNGTVQLVSKEKLTIDPDFYA
jgi:hypothetical protein